MAKYNQRAKRKIALVMNEFKKGRLKNGADGSTVKNRRQAVAIGISEARKTGAKVPKNT